MEHQNHYSMQSCLGKQGVPERGSASQLGTSTPVPAVSPPLVLLWDHCNRHTVLFLNSHLTALAFLLMKRRYKQRGDEPLLKTNSYQYVCQVLNVLSYLILTRGSLGKVLKLIELRCMQEYV